MDRFIGRMIGQDFGQLLHLVRSKFKLKPTFLHVMKEAKFFRNHLAHEFWVAHFGNLRSERGRIIIMEHCGLYERNFDRVSDILINATALDAAKYISVLDQQHADEGAFVAWEERLALAKNEEAKRLAPG